MAAPNIQCSRFKNTVAASRAATVGTLLPGWKILCGGAQVVLANASAENNMLTACYPTGVNQWTAMSKDQGAASPATITVYICAINDPDDRYDVQIFSSTTVSPTSHPTATVILPPGYILVGGGAQANFGFDGQFLVISAPLGDLSGWTAASQDHLASDPGTVTAYAVGIRDRSGAASIQTFLSQQTSTTAQSAPSEDVPVPPQYTLVGGGAAVSMSGSVGNLLTSSYPRSSQEWSASSHDHLQADAETITAYAIGAIFS